VSTVKRNRPLAMRSSERHPEVEDALPDFGRRRNALLAPRVHLRVSGVEQHGKEPPRGTATPADLPQPTASFRRRAWLEFQRALDPLASPKRLPAPMREQDRLRRDIVVLQKVVDDLLRYPINAATRITLIACTTLISDRYERLTRLELGGPEQTT
jgi:hypothetical protein